MHSKTNSADAIMNSSNGKSAEGKLPGYTTEDEAESSISSERNIKQARMKIRKATADGAKIVEESKLATRLEVLLQKKDDQLDILTRKKKMVRDQLKALPRKTDSEAKEYKKLNGRAKQLLADAEEEVNSTVAALDREISATRAQLSSAKATPTKHKIEELDELCSELRERSAASKRKKPDKNDLREMNAYLRSAAEGNSSPVASPSKKAKNTVSTPSSATSVAGKAVPTATASACEAVVKDKSVRRDVINRELAKDIATFVMDWMLGEGDMGPFESKEIGAAKAADVGPVVPKSFPHEQELEMCVLPRRLEPGVFDKKICAGLPDSHTMLSRMAKTVEGIASVQQLHSLTLTHMLHLQRSTRRLVAGNSPAGDEATAIIEKTTEAILLASDPDLKLLPFKDTSTFAHFLRDQDRIVKLSIFIMTYVGHGRNFVSDLLNLLMTPNLQGQVYWSGSTKRQGREYLPLLVELYIVRVARAMHALEETGKEFDEADFVREAKALLQNTERNLKKRQLAANVQIAGKTNVVPRKRASEPGGGKSLYSFAWAKLQLGGPRTRKQLLDGIRKTSMVYHNDTAASEVVGKLLETVNGTADLQAIRDYVNGNSENLQKISFID